ncbi:ABC transporter [Saccharospirillum sp. MSK14-1]|uniref:branched-chain amino acid ABC transporter ATP-binding protein/permease n=1 Tax=Saccharospirillum sp. MSK14-1 TaxID=1897632 RepID=UPI000D378153|nr:branched-chain amino acid ABC transporter ATP-binding protein/permease [Saccharospirillum sp. MSK14-1]PTY36522.1 ABC transporter [Saccharospirillum sp. MSK14-1]
MSLLFSANRLLLSAFALATLAAVLLLDSYWLLVFTLCTLTALVGVGLNVLMGLAGQISFGHIAFYALGGYASALLLLADWPFLTVLPVATLGCALIGALLAIPATRVTGPYLAMITIAFSFVIHHSLIEWDSLTGGANGLMGIPMPQTGGFDPNRALALLAAAVLVVALGLYSRFYRSGWGKAIRAVKASPIAARSLGFNPVHTKTVAFALSAGLTGLAGAFLPPLMMFISPSTFPFSQSILFVLVVIVGGTGTLWGPILGACIVVVLPELLAPLAEYRLLIFAALLLTVLWLSPKGLVGEIQQRFTRLKQETVNASPEPRSSTGHKDNATALTVQGLSIAFGGVQAAKDVSFQAPPGQITSIIGPNGAGKTTVLNLISGFYQPDQGSIELDTDLTGYNAWRIARAGIARTYQTSELFDEMSVLENVLSAMQQGRLGNPLLDAKPEQKDAALQWLKLVGFQGSIHTPTQDLPHVDRRLVEIARALAAEPKVLLLDEPAAGLSREDTDQLATLLQRIAGFGIAVILVEHDMQLVMGVSDQVLVLDAGKPIALGQPAEVQSNPAVIAAYLGGTDYQSNERTMAWQGSRDALLFTKGLTIDYGAAPVVEDVDLVVNPGELVAILGANGAGKSSILRALAGLKRPVGGRIGLHDRYIEQLNAHDIAHRGLALVPEGRQLFKALSVRDNLLLGAHTRNADLNPDAEIEAILQRFPRLRERIDAPAGLLSGGEQQMVALGRALMAKPSLLLLDEPSLGLAPAMIAELYDALAALRDDGVTLLLVDQMANLALQVADRAYVLETGRIVRSGDAKTLLADPALAAAYLGGNDAEH